VLLRLRALSAEPGSALVLVVFLSAALLLLSVTLVDAVRVDSSRSAQAVIRDAAFQAAEAGIDDYLSKLLDDNQYYLHDVAQGESTRRASGGQVASPGSSSPTPWAYGTTWTYPNGKNHWRHLPNGYEYNLQITGPTGSTPWVDIVATGRKQGTTGPYRVLQERVRPASVADFQMISNVNVSYGSTASTYGKIYSGGNIAHSGTAYANLYAENSITGNPTMMSGALKYDHSSIRTVIKSPINFASFATSLVDIQRAAQLSGIYLDDATKDAWQLTFNGDGTVSVKSCTKTSGNAIETVAPTCGTATTYGVPTNGAIYANQSVIVSWPSAASTVNGRVTVASNGNVVVGGNIANAQAGDDVLGLIAKNEMIVAQWAPCPLSWQAATVAQTGAWRSASSSELCNKTATFTGSAATAQGGYMTQYRTRVYNYDSTLSYLQPPWFPTIDYAYTVLLFRELPAGS
jgi:hypothetical protein